MTDHAHGIHHGTAIASDSRATAFVPGRSAEHRTDPRLPPRFEDDRERIERGVGDVESPRPAEVS